MGGETFAGRALSLDLPMEEMILCLVLVITNEAHVAFSGARTHSNNTAERTAMVEAFYYDSKHAAGVCLGTIQTRTHVRLALACKESMLCTEHRLRLTMQHVYGHTGNLGNECPDHVAALGSFPFTTLPPAGFVITLTHLPVVMVVTASVRFWKDCIALDLKQRRYFRMGISVVFIIGVVVSLTYAFVPFVILLSALFRCIHFLLFRKNNGKPNFGCLYRIEFW